MSKIKRFRKNPMSIGVSVLHRLSGLITNDSLYLLLLYFFSQHKVLHLKDPQRFTEKIQWLKLHVRKPEMTTMVDKAAVKDYVANIIGHEYIIPTIGIWESFDKIDFGTLPDQFVLKTTHGGGSGGVVICRDKSKFNLEEAKAKLESSLKSDIYIHNREWPYKNVPRRIIAEKFIEIPDKQDLSDFKIYCFNGEPRYIQHIQDRHTDETIDFYDTEWNRMEFYGLNPLPRPSASASPRPSGLEKMLSAAQKLAVGLPFVRVDMYQIKDEVLFGELTFYPASGLGMFTPDKYDYILGDMLKLPK